MDDISAEYLDSQAATHAARALVRRAILEGARVSAELDAMRRLLVAVHAVAGLDPLAEREGALNDPLEVAERSVDIVVGELVRWLDLQSVALRDVAEVEELFHAETPASLLAEE